MNAFAVFAVSLVDAVGMGLEVAALAEWMSRDSVASTVDFTSVADGLFKVVAFFESCDATSVCIVLSK